MHTWTNGSNCSVNCSWGDNTSFWSGEHPENNFPAPVLTGISIICSFLFLVGVSGNLMTIFIVAKHRDMRTTTNLYLSSMALSDLLIFLCMPLDVYRVWRYRPWYFGDILCKLFQFVSECCTYSTILNITALSVERYFAICFPLRAKVVVTKGRVRGVIMILWTVSLLCAGPVFVLVGVEHESGTNAWRTSECTATKYAIQSGLFSIMVWVSSVFFFLPVFCLTILYSLIGRKLWRRPNISSRDKNNKQTVKMLVVVVVAFVLCWLPFHLVRYLISKSLETGSPLIAAITQYFTLISFVLFYLSAAINPILYNIMSKKYRDAACLLFGIKKTSRRTASSVRDGSSPGLTESSVSL
ncbi:hypothetical protein ACEWY4_006740 [Coilia grayii]|uniref:Growth hormone secretagogue receptor type 1 n=1 Tax=Coilia grayii TaxID=363190 RepID=A0ABD1KF82_9TELE